MADSGRKINSSKYDLVKELGYGSEGIAYLVFQRDRGEYAVFKEIMDVRNYSHESDFLAQLACCDRVIKMIGTLEDAANTIVLEYMIQGDLRQIIREKNFFFSTMKWSRKLFFIQQLLDAVAAIYDLGILHLDIKPSNILIGAGDILKLSDFGRAQKLGPDGISLTPNLDLPGTYQYMPLEVLEKKPDFNSYAVDIWSAIITILEILQEKTVFKLQAFEIRRDMVVKINRFLSNEKIMKEQLTKMCEAMPKAYRNKFIDQILIPCLTNLPLLRPKAREISEILTSLRKEDPENTCSIM